MLVHQKVQQNKALECPFALWENLFPNLSPLRVVSIEPLSLPFHCGHCLFRCDFDCRWNWSLEGCSHHRQTMIHNPLGSPIYVLRRSDLRVDE